MYNPGVIELMRNCSHNAIKFNITYYVAVIFDFKRGYYYKIRNLLEKKEMERKNQKNQV